MYIWRVWWMIWGFFSQAGWPGIWGFPNDGHIWWSAKTWDVDTNSWRLMGNHTYFTVFWNLDVEFNLGTHVFQRKRKDIGLNHDKQVQSVQIFKYEQKIVFCCAIVNFQDLLHNISFMSGLLMVKMPAWMMLGSNCLGASWVVLLSNWWLLFWTINPTKNRTPRYSQVHWVSLNRQFQRTFATWPRIEVWRIRNGKCPMMRGRSWGAGMGWFSDPTSYRGIVLWKSFCAFRPNDDSQIFRVNLGVPCVQTNPSGF